MNTNAFHNLINVILAIVGTLMFFDWSVLGLEAEIIAGIMGALGFIKLLVNTIRDGLAGLVKPQPPVV